LDIGGSWNVGSFPGSCAIRECCCRRRRQDMASTTFLPMLVDLYQLLDGEEEKGKDTVNFKLLQRYLDRGNHNNSGQEDPPSFDDDEPSKETLTIKTHVQELIVLSGQLLSQEDSSAPPSHK
jgi:hypothetical protein